MQNILNDDKMDILKELSENKCDLDAVVATVEELGIMADVDKLQVHIKELESVTRLLTVLKVRVETAENKLKIARAVEKVSKTGNIALMDKIQTYLLLTYEKNTRMPVLVNYA